MFNILKKSLFSVVLTMLVLSTALFANEKQYEGPIDGAGDVAVERIGLMEGNAIRLQFRNTTELSDWGSGTDPYASKWPNDFRGSKMNDGVGLMIGARVYLEKDGDPTTVDSVIVDDPTMIETYAGDLDTLYFLQASYREEMDMDPTGQVEWALYPPRGYFNNSIPDVPPAISNRSDSWPLQGWPAQGFDKKWAGEWNGRFGRGVIKADLECFFVANDAQDQEYLQDTSKVKYYPKPGVRIGDIDPEVTVQYGLPWGGLGIRVEQRGFQWNNPQSRDAIFWEYSIANTTEYNITEVGFGYWVDNAIGGNDGNDEFAAFDTKLDLAYSWDADGLGDYGLAVGTMGFAYLESPANFVDGKDNDEDGITDERRDNTVMPGEAMIGPEEGYSSVANFLDFYKLEQSDLREHFAADEDQDWDPFIDSNGNGQWDPGEDIGDDVGTDGVGPDDLNWEEPDANGTEANGIPDFIEGLGSEPDFASTDISESDMLGLTSFRLFPIPNHTAPYRYWFRNDASMWELVGSDSLVPYIGEVSNLAEVFATGVFPLWAGNTERVSMSQLHSWDAGENIIAGDPVENPPTQLFRKKEIVQVIYERDYRFAQPPLMPTLTATEGDGYVLLSWDNISETKTRDSFVNNENDFEGYKLFKATDRNFTDARQVTDGFGAKQALKALFQCDKIDNIKGFAEFGIVDGMAYYLGNDTGLKHTYRDINVQNGRTYYYALVAYDYGIEDIGVSPSENNIVVEVNDAEEITFVSKNVAIATPHQEAAGYEYAVDSNVEGVGQTLGNGTIIPEVLAKSAVRSGTKYKIKFDIHEIKPSTLRNIDWGLKWVTNGYKIYNGDAVVYEENPDLPGTALVDSTESLEYWFLRPDTASTDLFDGIQLKIVTDVIEPEYDYQNSGWLQGTSPMNVIPTLDESTYFPWDYDIIFTDTLSTSTYEVKRSHTINNEDDVRIREDLLGEQSYPFVVVNNSILDENGDPEIMELVVQDMDQDGEFNMLNDRIFVGALDSRDRWASTVFVMDFAAAVSEEELPQPGDVYQVRFKRPFYSSDSLMFTVNINETTQIDDIKEALKDVKVVPNPYVATNALEPVLANKNFNQRRQIMFTHLPSQCSIKIFTVSGVLVREIEVDNDADNGIAYWDVLTKDGLEVAAGMYIYHLTAEATGDEIMGKFAIIK